ncbi:hypothetical protein FQA47_013869 [Oryzias melastigma]|uniref:Uncharacterized protein n=1 Tax=Oryzias melastigma TaxID=30732 RepID=A0A834BU44_ORYME|nr:hypothetical protein FQA47_013869 [Oryzias melastigma]
MNIVEENLKERLCADQEPSGPSDPSEQLHRSQQRAHASASGGDPNISARPSKAQKRSLDCDHQEQEDSTAGCMLQDPETRGGFCLKSNSNRMTNSLRRSSV